VIILFKKERSRKMKYVRNEEAVIRSTVKIEYRKSLISDNFHSSNYSENVRKRKEREYYSRKKDEICEKGRCYYQVNCKDFDNRELILFVSTIVRIVRRIVINCVSCMINCILKRNLIVISLENRIKY